MGEDEGRTDRREDQGDGGNAGADPILETEGSWKMVEEISQVEVI